MTNPQFSSLKARLDQQTAWPMVYMFKFIVPENEQERVASLFTNHELVRRHSSKGNYVSVTVQMFVRDSQEVIDVYQRASAIEGLIAL